MTYSGPNLLDLKLQKQPVTKNRLLKQSNLDSSG